MKNLKIKFLNEIDLSVLDNDFFVEMLNNILNCKKVRCKMNYPQTKVYFDGSHYIGIPKLTQPFKRRKNKQKAKDEKELKVKEIYKESIGTKKEKIEKSIEEINKEINDIEKSTKLVNGTLEKEKRNRIVRQTRLSRKLELQNWTHFCTFTYDSQKLNEEEFRKKFLNCLRHLSNRKG